MIKDTVRLYNSYSPCPLARREFFNTFIRPVFDSFSLCLNQVPTIETHELQIIKQCAGLQSTACGIHTRAIYAIEKFDTRINRMAENLGTKGHLPQLTNWNFTRSENELVEAIPSIGLKLSRRYILHHDKLTPKPTFDHAAFTAARRNIRKSINRHKF